MTISNPNRLERYDAFNEKHHDILGTIPNRIESCDVTSIPEVIRQNLGDLFSVNCFDSPYQMYSTGDVYYIVENISLIQSAQLSDDERDALIAHEIGHVVCSIERRELAKEDDEIDADSYASKLGYNTALISALDKIKGCACIPCDERLINKRIEQLRGD